MSTTWKEAITHAQAPSGTWALRRLTRAIAFVVVLMIATVTGVTDLAIELVQYAATSDVAAVRRVVLWLCLAGVLLWLAGGVLVEAVVSVLYYKRNHDREMRWSAYVRERGCAVATREDRPVGGARSKAPAEKAATEFVPASEIAGQGDLLDCIPGEDRGTEAIAARLEASQRPGSASDEEGAR